MEPPSQRKTSSEPHIMHLRILTRSPLQVDVERRNYSLLLVIRLNAKHSRKARSWPNGLLRCRIFQREYIPTGMRAVFRVGKSQYSRLSRFSSAKLLQRLPSRSILRRVLLAIFPWAPAYLFERADFWFGQTNNGYWYYQFSTTRLEADVVSFALGGILVAYLLRPRWAVVQVFLSASLIYVLFYLACPTYLAGTI